MLGSRLMEVMMQKLPILALAASLALAVPALAAETIPLSSDWNELGQQPDRCAPQLTGGGKPPKWVIIRPDGKWGIAETTRDTTDYRFPLCVVDDTAFPRLADVDVSVRIRPMDGSVDQAGGLAVRVKDARNYYVVRANALEDNVRLYVVLDGDRKQFAGVNRKVASKQWHTLRLRAIGDRFTVFFDGEQLFEASDKRISGAGGVALWSKADSVTEFTDLAIEAAR
jgi:hypothetical protein